MSVPIRSETPSSEGVALLEPSRRRFLRSLGRGLGALGLGVIATHAFGHQHAGQAQQHDDQTGHAGMGGASADAPLLAPHPIPWQDGTCAFCGMTIATPAGAPQGEGFRERTYAQWVLPGDAEAAARAVHFESIACALNYAYVHGVRDGLGGSLFVTDIAGSLPASAELLVPARRAVFHWGEHLRVAMMARLIAFADDEARDAHARAHPDEGRQARYGLVTLEDLAPLPEMNLIPLLARHAGLLDGS